MKTVFKKTRKENEYKPRRCGIISNRSCILWQWHHILLFVDFLIPEDTNAHSYGQTHSIEQRYSLKINGYSVSHEIPQFYGSQSFITMNPSIFHLSLYSAIHMQNRISSFMVYFNIILQYTLRFLQVAYFFRLSNQNLVCTSLPCMPHAHPSDI